MKILPIILLFCVLTTAASVAEPATRTNTVPRVPLLYCTDLFHPHEDPDDHFDLATVYAIPEFDLRGIVLDQGARQDRSPGRIPVSQLNALSGRKVPTGIGLSTPLASPNDQALDQPAAHQSGIRLILNTLRAATSRVDLIAVGSVRDLAAAFNREPALFHRQAGRVMVFIGEASRTDFREYNVGLDPHAFVRLLRSGLNLCWVPCFDGGLWQNGGHASFWQATHARLLASAPPELVQYFIYALEKETAEPLGFLRQPVDPARREVLFQQTRNLWCAAIFRSLLNDGVPTSQAFTFEPVNVVVSDDAVVRYETGPASRRILRFKVRDHDCYAADMTAATAAVLARFPIVTK